METFLHKLGVVAASILLSASSIFGISQPAEAPANVGATIPAPIALFQTSLASSIAANDTSMTLVSATTKDGTTLSGTYGFIIDEGSAPEEFVNAVCTGTSCVSMTRGLSVVNGTSTITTLKQTHRRGASVKITDAPQILIISRILNGDETLPNPVKYDTSVTNAAISASNSNLVNVSLLNATAFGSTPVGIPAGGTGVSTLPAGILVGAGTSAITATSTPYGLAFNTSSTTATSTFVGHLAVQNNFYATGTSTLSGSTTIAATATNRLTLNGQDYSIQSNKAASSTSLVTDGKNNLTFGLSGGFSFGQGTVTSTSTGVVGITFAHGLSSIPRLFKLYTAVKETNCSPNSITQGSGGATGTGSNQSFTGVATANGSGAFQQLQDTSRISEGYCLAGGTTDFWTITTYDSTNIKMTLTNAAGGAVWQFQWEAFQ